MASLIQPRPLLLASTSPRRMELLRAAGYDFEPVSPRLEEPDEEHPHIDPLLWPESMAYFKAASVAEDHPGKIILGADTVAIVGDEIIGKPDDRADARRILRTLSGTTHQVVTGLALLRPSDGHRMMDRDVSLVHVKELSDAEIDEYLDTGAWQGKAGAYGVQDDGDRFVTRIEGSFSNVVGLPLERLAALFERWRASDSA